MYLLPYCLDKWRKFVKERRVFRFWMKQIEARTGNQDKDLKFAFEKWATTIFGRRAMLASMQFGDLKYLEVNNRQERMEVSKRIEEH